MTWPTLTIGRLTLRETFELESSVNTQTDRRTLGLKGEESYPPLPTVAELNARQEDFLGLLNRFVPIVFGNKSQHDGWYIITDVNTTPVDYGPPGSAEVAKFAWSLQAVYVGPPNAVDVESRLSYVVRQNDFGVTGERWHAPAAGVTAYFTGSNLPGASTARPSSDGPAVTVYRSTPAGVSPRWSSTLAGYQSGRARVLAEGRERTATNFTLSPSTWVLTNGLVSVSAAPTATLQFALWDGTAWDTKLFNVSAAGSATDLGIFDAATVLRNDYEAVTVRLLKSKAPGRTMLDLTLRRGSHFVEGYLSTDTSATLAVFLENAEAGTAPASTGYVTATANDAAGNRYVVGSARSFTALTAQGGIQKAAATTLDFFFGLSLAGGSASAGNAAVDLRNQFIVFSAEDTIGVRR